MKSDEADRIGLAPPQADIIKIDVTPDPAGGRGLSLGEIGRVPATALTGIELSHVEFVSNVSITGTNEVDVVTADALELEAGEYAVEFFSVRLAAGGAGAVRLELKSGSTHYGQMIVISANEESNPAYFKRRLTLARGAYTFKVVGQNTSSQTSTVTGNVGGADDTSSPGYICVSRVQTMTT